MGPRRVCRAALSGVVFVLSGAAGGCVSYGSHLAATPLAAGTRELSLNADALVIDRGLGAQVLPNPEVGYRVGLSRNVDVGGRVNAGSLELNTRVRLHGGLLDLAVIPGLGFGFVPVTNAETGLFNAHALTSVVAGFHPAPRWDIVLGGRAALTYAFPLTAFRGVNDGDELIYLLGGVFGVRGPLGARSYIFPDINLLFPYRSRDGVWSFPTLQGGVAFAFD